MDEPKVAPFALTYRQKMMGELGFVKEEAYGFWHTFAEQAILRFGSTHEAEKALLKLSTVKYQGDIAKFVLEMENLNIHAKVSGVAWRKMIEYQLPEQALFRMSMHHYDDDAEWMAEIRRVTQMDEDFKERKGL